jgi:protein-tyrosine phosphatase
MFRRLWDQLRPPRLLIWITPDLAIGPAIPGNRLHLLTNAGIGSVMDIREEASDDPVALERRGLHFLHLPVKDHGAPTQAQLRQATKWTLSEFATERKVYIHCRGGIGRSPCIATAVLTAIGYPLTDAYAAVRKERPWAVLSESQLKALQRFQKAAD